MTSATATSLARPSHELSLVHGLAALYYIGVSTSLTVFNKLLFNAFVAVDPVLLLLFQAATTLLILALLTLAKRFKPPPSPFLIILRDRPTFLVYLPLLLSYATMLVTSLVALRFTSLLMYNTVRRTSILFVVALHAWSTRSTPATYTLLATFLTLAGALFASLTDLSFDPFGYALAILANAATAIFLVLLRPVRDRLQFSNTQLLFFNTLCIFPLLALLTLLMPPKHSIIPLFVAAANSSSPKFPILFACSCCLAVVITHATYVNTTVNDAVTQTICSQVKDLLLLSASYFLVDDPTARANGNLVGVFIGFAGSLVYAIGKLRDASASAAASAQAKQNAPEPSRIDHPTKDYMQLSNQED